jgi:hypothetical protein
MTLTKNGWRLVVFVVLGGFQYCTAEEEVELKNIRIGSCRRVNITSLGIKHGRHCGSRTMSCYCRNDFSKTGNLEYQYKMMEMVQAKAQKLQN